MHVGPRLDHCLTGQGDNSADLKALARHPSVQATHQLCGISCLKLTLAKCICSSSAFFKNVIFMQPPAHVRLTVDMQHLTASGYEVN